MSQLKGLFVAYGSHLGPGKGGVQKCTREFFKALNFGSIDLEVLAVKPDRRLLTRLGRRLNTSPYWRSIDLDGIQNLRRAVANFDFVFLNQVALAGSLQLLEVNRLKTKIILLSHGCEITDLLHIARLEGSLPLTSRQLGISKELTLALTLRDEFKARTHVDGAICISPYDADTEAWLGTRQVCWIPRAIEPQPLERSPVSGVFGFVGTLDHAPNLEGLVAILEEMQGLDVDDLTIRVVGGPDNIGSWLDRSFKNVDYVGQLDDEALLQEAKSWEAFLNPIFCLARGCSTKLAEPISWAIPIVTSSLGRRGYYWEKGRLIEANDPSEFVSAMRRFADTPFSATVFEGVQEVAETSPQISDVGIQVTKFLSQFSKSAKS